MQLARNKVNGQLVAIKFLERGPDKVRPSLQIAGQGTADVLPSDLTLHVPVQITKHVEREIINHSNFCHPHIVQFKEVFLTPEHLAIAMEFVPGGDMFQHVKRNKGLPEPEAWPSFRLLLCLAL